MDIRKALRGGKKIKEIFGVLPTIYSSGTERESAGTKASWKRLTPTHWVTTARWYASVVDIHVAAHHLFTRFVLLIRLGQRHGTVISFILNTIIINHEKLCNRPWRRNKCRPGVFLNREIWNGEEKKNEKKRLQSGRPICRCGSYGNLTTASFLFTSIKGHGVIAELFFSFSFFFVCFLKRHLAFFFCWSDGGFRCVLLSFLLLSMVTALHSKTNGNFTRLEYQTWSSPFFSLSLSLTPYDIIRVRAAANLTRYKVLRKRRKLWFNGPSRPTSSPRSSFSSHSPL